MQASSMPELGDGKNAFSSKRERRRKRHTVWKFKAYPDHVIHISYVKKHNLFIDVIDVIIVFWYVNAAREKSFNFHTVI